jgi:hypothetical protein
VFVFFCSMSLSAGSLNYTWLSISSSYADAGQKCLCSGPNTSHVQCWIGPLPQFAMFDRYENTRVSLSIRTQVLAQRYELTNRTLYCDTRNQNPTGRKFAPGTVVPACSLLACRIQPCSRASRLTVPPQSSSASCGIESSTWERCRLMSLVSRSSSSNCQADRVDGMAGLVSSGGRRPNSTNSLRSALYLPAPFASSCTPARARTNLGFTEAVCVVLEDWILMWISRV